MKVGDLVKVLDDPHNFCGIGILYVKDGRHLGKVLWFDEDLNRNQDDWIQVRHLENVNEQQKDT